jgi:hypothetical protein
LAGSAAILHVSSGGFLLFPLENGKCTTNCRKFKDFFNFYLKRWATHVLPKAYLTIALTGKSNLMGRSKGSVSLGEVGTILPSESSKPFEQSLDGLHHPFGAVPVCIQDVTVPHMSR